MYILSTAYLCFHVKATLFETVYLFMVGSVCIIQINSIVPKAVAENDKHQ